MSVTVLVLLLYCISLRRVRQLLGPVWRQTGLLLFDGFAMDGEIFDDPSIYAGTSGTSLKHAVNREKDDYRFWPLRCGHFMNGIAFEEVRLLAVLVLPINVPLQCPYLVPRDGVPSSVQLRSTEVTDITAEDLSIALEDVSPSQHTGLQGESHAAQGDDNGGGRVRSVPSGSCSFTCPSKFEVVIQQRVGEGVRCCGRYQRRTRGASIWST